MISCCYLWTFPGRSSRAAQAVCIPQAEGAMPPSPAAAGPSFGEGSGCGSHPAAAAERTTPLPGAQAAAAEPRTHLGLQQQHGEGCGERLAGHPFPTAHGLPWPAQSCSRTTGRRVLFGARPIPPHLGQCEQKATDDLSPSPLLKAAPGLSAALWSRWAACPRGSPAPHPSVPPPGHGCGPGGRAV